MTKTLRKSITHRSRLKNIYISVKEMITIGEIIRTKEIFVLTFCKTKKYQKSKSQKYQASVFQNWCIFFYISMFVVSVIIGRYEWIKNFMWLSNHKNNLDIGQKPH